MTLFRSIRPFVLAVALVAAPAALGAQEAPTASQPDPQVQGWVTELQQVHAKLQGIQVKALQDPVVSAAQDSLGASIKASMEAIDPALAASMTRVQQLEAQYNAAQAAGDTVKQQQISAEANQIQQQFMTAQQRALQQPEIAAKMEAFQGQLEAKMVEVDPQAKDLITRFRTLEQQIASVLQGGGGQQQP